MYKWVRENKNKDTRKRSIQIIRILEVQQRRNLCSLERSIYFDFTHSHEYLTSVIILQRDFESKAKRKSNTHSTAPLAIRKQWFFNSTLRWLFSDHSLSRQLTHSYLYIYMHIARHCFFYLIITLHSFYATTNVWVGREVLQHPQKIGAIFICNHDLFTDI